MSDALDNLIARSRGQLTTVRPRLPALFEPPRVTELSPWAEAPTAATLRPPAARSESARDPAAQRRAAAPPAPVHTPDPLSARAYPAAAAAASAPVIPASAPEPPVARLDARQAVPARPTVAPPVAALAQRAEPVALPVSFLPPQSEDAGAFEAREHSGAPEPAEAHQAMASDWLGQPAETANDARPPELAVSEQPRSAQATPESFTLTRPLAAPVAANRVTLADAPEQRAVAPARTIAESAVVPPRGVMTARPAPIVPEQRGDSPSTVSSPPPTRPAEMAPVVRVTIGRVEVRAVTPAPATPQRAAKPTAPALSLSDYLRQQGGGRR